MADTTAYTPLTPQLHALRETTMTNNGIHTIYPLGSDQAHHYGIFSAYENFIARVFGYVLGFSSNYEWAVYGYGGYAIMKIDNNNKQALAVMHAKSGYEFQSHGEQWYHVGKHYSFAIKAIQNHYQAILTEQAVQAVPLPYEWMNFTNLNSASNRQLSTHFCDANPDAHFPVDEGLDKLLHAFVRFDVGSYLIYTGIYKGNDAIRVKDVEGAVGSLGKPHRTGIFVKVGIRVTTRKFVFTTDYGSTPVVAGFEELVQEGYNYIPRFYPSFNVRHVMIESTRYTP